MTAPSKFSGNLSMYGAITWDEYIYPNSPSPNYCTYPMIEASDGTLYRVKDRNPREEGAWYQRSVPFDDSGWVLIQNTGSLSFAEVIEDVAAVMISMDVSRCSYRRESGIDNVNLVVDGD